MGKGPLHLSRRGALEEITNGNGRTICKVGLGLFVFGIFLTFGIIAHYCVGASVDNGPQFMKNITLWWACPWTLSVAAGAGR